MTKQPTFTDLTIGKRTAHLHVPPVAATWLLVGLHPSHDMGGGRNFAKLTNLYALGDTAPFYSLWPDGSPSPKGGLDWNPADTSPQGDMAFLAAAVAQVKATYSTISHVAFVGYSNGGGMAAAFLTAHPALVDALALCSGGFTNDTLRQYGLPTKPLTVVMAWGLQDTIWPADSTGSNRFGPQLLGAQANFDIFSQAAATMDDVPLAPVADTTTVSVQSGSDGINGTTVTLYLCKDGGHTWPSGGQKATSGLLGPVNTQLDFSAVVVQTIMQSVVQPA